MFTSSFSVLGFLSGLNLRWCWVYYHSLCEFICPIASWRHCFFGVINQLWLLFFFFCLFLVDLQALGKGFVNDVSFRAEYPKLLIFRTLSSCVLCVQKVSHLQEEDFPMRAELCVDLSPGKVWRLWGPRREGFCRLVRSHKGTEKH